MYVVVVVVVVVAIDKQLWVQSLEYLTSLAY